ncbi:MAG TPA: hypothetical protein VFW50_23665 [Streptosporangiaceae bacterium]|nr:hypothetical protein [Streptosporangiaceae bacterium]
MTAADPVAAHPRSRYSGRAYRGEVQAELGDHAAAAADSSRAAELDPSYHPE